MAKIKNMGTSTVGFKEGAIVSGSTAQPNGTFSDYALVVTGSQLIDYGSLKVSDDLYVDKIRRYTDSGTTTKLLLNDEQIKLYAGHSSNPICTVDTVGLKIDNGTLAISAMRVGVRDVNSTSSVLATDYILRCHQNSGITLTLPAKNSNVGRVLIFKDALGNAGSPNSHTITLDGDSSDAIDGNATYVISHNREAVTLTCDGINGWMMTSRVKP